MGPEIAEFILLIHGDLFEIEARGVNMRSGDDGPPLQRFFSDDRKHQCFAAVDLIHAISRNQSLSRLKLPEAQFLCPLDGIADSFSLGARFVQKCHILPAIRFNSKPFFGINPVIAVFLLIKQILSHVFHALTLSPVLHSSYV